MHELPIVTQIVKQVLSCADKEQAAGVKEVWLEIGSLHDLIDEWVQKYFVFATRGTLAEGARLHIARTPVICRCENCLENFTADVKKACGKIRCPVCGEEKFHFLLGNELLISRIALEKEG